MQNTPISKAATKTGLLQKKLVLEPYIPETQFSIIAKDIQVFHAHFFVFCSPTILGDFQKGSCMLSQFRYTSTALRKMDYKLKRRQPPLLLGVLLLFSDGTSM